MKYYQLIDYTKLCIMWGFTIPITPANKLNVALTNSVYIRLKKNGTPFKRDGGHFVESIKDIKAPFILIKGRY